METAKKEFKGTKGEWVVDTQYLEKYESTKATWCQIKVKGRLIVEAKGLHYKVPQDECFANAKLIAAAPELLEVLIKLLPIAKHLCTKCTPDDLDLSGFSLAESAINKAISSALGE